MKLEELRKNIIDIFISDCAGNVKWVFNDDCSIDIIGDVCTPPYVYVKFPVKFRKIYGSFNCSYNYLDNLKNCPEEVDNIFCCSHNQLISLEFAPKKVGSFLCGHNPVKFTEADIRKVCEVSNRVIV